MHVHGFLHRSICGSLVLVLAVATHPAFARGFGGGGGARGGGGGVRAGGGSLGGGLNRGSMGGGAGIGGAGLDRGGFDSGRLGSAGGSGALNPSRPGDARSAGSFDRGPGSSGLGSFGGSGGVGGANRGIADRGGLGSFGGRPGAASGLGDRGDAYRAGAAVNPNVYSGPRGAVNIGSVDKSYTTKGGSTVNVDGTGGVASGPRGGTAAAGRVNVAVDGARGNSFDAAARGAAVAGPGGRYAAAGERGSVARGADGTVARGSRGAVAGGPDGAVGRRSGFAAATIPGETGFAHFSSRGYSGAGGTYRVSRTSLHTQGTAIRAGWVHSDCFSAGWYGAHPGCWRPNVWRTPNLWAACTWATLGAYCGSWLAAPVAYDYGTTVVYENDGVYANGQQLATTEQYYDQATQIAAAGATDSATDAANAGQSQDAWQSIGVFALAQQGQSQADEIFQLAMNAEGVIRGNFYNATTNQTQPVTGSVDQKSQRAAWVVGDEKTPVFEAGLYNLTQEQTTVLLHYSADHTEQWVLVRLQQDGSTGNGGNAASSPSSQPSN